MAPGSLVHYCWPGPLGPHLTFVIIAHLIFRDYVFYLTFILASSPIETKASFSTEPLQHNKNIQYYNEFKMIWRLLFFI